MVPPLLFSVGALLLLSGVLIRERFFLGAAADRVDRIITALEDME
jgi:hypothetical protein